MLYFLEVFAALILGLWVLSALCVVLIRTGIREYFRQKRLYLLAMLQAGVPEESIPKDK